MRLLADYPKACDESGIGYTEDAALLALI